MMEESRAARFQAYLDGRWGAIKMSRSLWEHLIQDQDGPIELDISNTPLASLAYDVKIVGSFAERSENGQVIIKIFRDDPKDAPNKINMDRHEIWEYVDSHLDYENAVVAASTNDDDALQSFLDDYVFLVPLEKGPGHHLPDVPAIYQVILESKKNAS
jgi:hypothetical protein